MPRVEGGSPEAASIDAKLAQWKQGDISLSEHVFVHVADPRRALSADVEAADDVDMAAVETLVPGVVVITQTCDLVRRCTDRPFVEVSPLVLLKHHENGIHIDGVRKGHHQRYLFVPAVADRGLVADLDRTMTLEKSLVAGWTRHPGCDTDARRQAIGQALARKRARMAFPDDFTRSARARPGMRPASRSCSGLFGR